MELSIVMPCLNEAKTLPVCLEKAFRFLATSGIEGEVVVADNGSTDGSIELARKMGARVVAVEEKGYGAALSEGIHQALGQFVIMGDSDDSYDFLELQPFVDKLREGYDLVMGNRFMGGISRGAMPFMHRYFGNPLLTMLGRRIYEHDVCGDFYCGLRGFRKEAIEGLRVQSQGMEFALEMVIKAELYNLKITEVPTTLRPDGRGRRPHLRTYRDGWRSLRLYLLMSPRWTFGIPGLVLGGAGLLLLALNFLGVVQETISLFAMALGMGSMVLGYQGILLAIFAKFVAIDVGLHPPASRFWILREEGVLEKFLLVGVVIVLGSFGLASLALAQAAYHFLPWMEGVTEDKLAFLSGLLFIVGGQTVIGGFCFGILQLMSNRRQFRRKRVSDFSDSGRGERRAGGA